VLGTNNICPIYNYSALALATDYPGTDNCEACAPFTCQNGGTCSGEQNEIFTCSCPPAFTGVNCETLGCGGVDVLTGCSCRSGDVGEGCELQEGGPCLPFPTVELLVTEPVAEFMESQSSISSDTFSFVIESPARDGRYFESIYLNDHTPFCSYPGPNLVKGFAEETCRDYFNGTFLIPELIHNCSFTETPEVGNLRLEGKIHVTAIDPVGSFRGNPISRTTKSVLTLNLLLPTTITLNTTDINVSAVLDMLIAVTRQEYEYNSDLLTLEFTTSVQYPYELQNPSFLTSLSTSIRVNSSSSAVDCASSPETPCTQTHTFEFSGIRTLAFRCDFTGDYEIQLEGICRSGYSPCPLSEPLPLFTNFTMETSDFCGSFSIDATLAGDLKSYSDSSFSTEKTSFLAGERIYVKASLSGDVSILDVQVKEVKVTQGGTAAILVQDGSVSLPFTDATLQFVSDEPGTASNEVGFSFVSLLGEDPSDVFDSSGGDSVFAFVLEASLEVVYQTTFGKKRDTLSERLSLAQTMVVVKQ